MGDRLKYERFLWFHDEVKSGKYPNATYLARQFEVSQRTAQRDIEFIRDRIKAPLLFDRNKNGYLYLDNSYELPPQWFSEESVLSLALAIRLSSAVPDERIKNDLCGFLDRILDRKRKGRFCFDDLSEKISVKNIEYSKVEGSLFHRVVDALFRELPIIITYFSPHKNEETVRVIMPLHLLHYMGNWHLVAYCTKRRDMRDFAISRIRSVEPASEPVRIPDNLPPVKEFVRRNFGIMHGGKRFEVSLLFSASVAEWIKEQVWHPHQTLTFYADGSLLLSFPASDFRELKKRILAHGADVKVLKPFELKIEIKNEIQKMKFRYDTK